MHLQKKYTMQRKSYLINKEKENCSGCCACANICPKSAITMTEDSEGFLYPVLNEKECINCGLCYNICPISNSNLNKKQLQQAYIATTSHTEFCQKSATIGLCTMLSIEILKKGGVVYGVELNELNWTANHIKITSIEEIDRIRNSKYLQSNTNTTYREVKQLLGQNINVMYVGTGCQIAGLKAFLRRDYPNLFLVDLICHGTFSHKMMKEEVKFWEKKFGGTVSNFHFRNKKITLGGVVDFDIKAKGKDFHVTRLAQYSPVYRLFTAHGDGKSYNLRQSCYSCNFREQERYGDITLGDPWGAKNLHPELISEESKKNGIGMAITNTEKGRYYYNLVSKYLTSTEIPLQDAFTQPALIPKIQLIPKERDILYEKLSTRDLGNLVETTLNINFEKLYTNYRIKQEYISLKRKIKSFILKVYVFFIKTKINI